MQVSQQMFDLENCFWEEPTDAEHQERNIELVSKGHLI